MIDRSVGMARHASSVCFQCSFSVISCWSVVWKKTDYSCAMPVDSMFRSIDSVGMSSLVFMFIFSSGFIFNPGCKPGAVFIISGMCALVTLICNTKLQVFHKGGGIDSVRKNWVTDLLSVMTITGLIAPQTTFTNSLRATWMGKNASV